jgi:D-ribose pyranase
MRKHGLLHPQLNRILSELGHGQTIVIADAGLPIPIGVERVDLALTAGVPGLLEVLGAVCAELCLEEAIFAAEITARSAHMHAAMKALIALPDAAFQYVAHETFKQRTATARAVIRTGEFTPYANVILRSGAPF